jgi:hypothetical protein
MIVFGINSRQNRVFLPVIHLVPLRDNTVVEMFNVRFFFLTRGCPEPVLVKFSYRSLESGANENQKEEFLLSHLLLSQEAKWSITSTRKRISFLSFPYVYPEPVLAK